MYTVSMQLTQREQVLCYKNCLSEESMFLHRWPESSIDAHCWSLGLVIGARLEREHHERRDHEGKAIALDHARPC